MAPLEANLTCSLFISGLVLQTYKARERARERDRERERKSERTIERERRRERERETWRVRVVMNDAGLFLALPDERRAEGVPISVLIFSLLVTIRETESRGERERAREPVLV